MDLPGLEAEDVDLSISGDMLTIRGQRVRQEEGKEEQIYSRERFCGSFQRSFRVPVGVRPDKAEASFHKGVLKITLPKAEETKKRVEDDR